MKEHEIIQALRRAGGEADMPSHRTALRRALLSAHSTMSGVLPLQTLLKNIMMKRKLLPAGALVALLAVSVFAFSLSNSSVALAQEQVDRSFARAVQISPEMRAELEAKMKSDMLETLKEAKAAPDLRILTKEQFEKESQFSFSTGPGPMLGTAKALPAFQSITMTHVGVARADDQGVGFTVNTEASPVTVTSGAVQAVSASAAQLKAVGVMSVSKDVKFTAGTLVNAGTFSEPVKYLSYTDPQGHKTALGLDENDTPVFKISTLNASDVQQMGKGMITIQGSALQMIEAKDAQKIEQ